MRITWNASAFNEGHLLHVFLRHLIIEILLLSKTELLLVLTHEVALKL